jgi:hypothetical protein
VRVEGGKDLRKGMRKVGFVVVEGAAAPFSASITGLVLTTKGATGTPPLTQHHLPYLSRPGTGGGGKVGKRMLGSEQQSKRICRHRPAA